MKRTFLTVVSCLLAAALLFGGVEFGAYMYSKTVPDFEDYQMSSYNVDSKTLRDEGYVISAPFWNGCMERGKLLDCYSELTNASRDYALFIAKRYRNKAKLTAEVSITSETLTIEFTGTGYNADGSEDDLSRTYIFDIDGAGKDKLPRLINKADIFPEL